MPPDRYPLASDPRHIVLLCPCCAKKGKTGDLRGPIDGKRSAQHLFTRSWFCRICYWDQVLVMLDDVAARAAKDAKRNAERAKRRGITV